MCSATRFCDARPLCRQDAEVIEILWKQDCDLGLTRSDFAPVLPVQEDAVPEKLARLGQEVSCLPTGRIMWLSGETGEHLRRENGLDL